MSKYICKQVAPELQTSPFEYCDESMIYRLVMLENRDFSERIGDGVPSYEYIKKALDGGQLYEDLTDAGTDDGWYKSIREAVNDYFPRETPYTDEELQTIKNSVTYYGGWDNVVTKPDEEIICDLLNIIEGGDWKTKELHGCSQGDWVRVLYDSDVWTEKQLDRIEAEFFNIGTEWEVVDEDGDSYFEYCTEWSDDGIKKELADSIGCEPDQVELWKFDGWSRTEKYIVA